MKNFYRFYFTIGFILLLVSCQRDDQDDQAANQQTCKLQSGIITDGSSTGSITYLYSGDNIVKVIVSPDENYQLEYQAGKVIRRNYFYDGSSISDSYEIINYNNDGTINNRAIYYSRFGLPIAKQEEFVFLYSSGKVSKITFSQLDGSVLAIAEEYEYTYTGNNITSTLTKVYDNEVFDGSYTITYTYDSNPNYFKKLNSNILFTKPIWRETEGDYLPIILSQNNVIGIVEDGTNYPLSYKLDDKQNFSEFNFPGTINIKYSYLCQ